MNTTPDYPIARTVTEAEAAQIANNTLIASGGVPGAIQAASPNVKTYFVAFDGTSNNMHDPSRPQTSVAALHHAAFAALNETQGGLARYYQGPGTQANGFASGLDALLGASVHSTASKAYSDLVSWAQRQFAANPNVQITLARSRFSQLWRRQSHSFPECSAAESDHEARGLPRAGRKHCAPRRRTGGRAGWAVGECGGVLSVVLTPYPVQAS